MILTFCLEYIFLYKSDLCGFDISFTMVNIYFSTSAVSIFDDTRVGYPCKKSNSN